jgi:hypothetical protein
VHDFKSFKGVNDDIFNLCVAYWLSKNNEYLARVTNFVQLLPFNGLYIPSRMPPCPQFEIREANTYHTQKCLDADTTSALAFAVTAYNVLFKFEDVEENNKLETFRNAQSRILDHIRLSAKSLKTDLCRELILIVWSVLPDYKTRKKSTEPCVSFYPQMVINNGYMSITDALATATESRCTTELWRSIDQYLLLSDDHSYLYSVLKMLKDQYVHGVTVDSEEVVSRPSRYSTFMYTRNSDWRHISISFPQLPREAMISVLKAESVYSTVDDDLSLYSAIIGSWHHEGNENIKGAKSIICHDSLDRSIAEQVKTESKKNKYFQWMSENETNRPQIELIVQYLASVFKCNILFVSKELYFKIFSEKFNGWIYLTMRRAKGDTPANFNDLNAGSEYEFGFLKTRSIVPDGYQVIENEGKNNCIFYAVRQALAYRNTVKAFFDRSDLNSTFLFFTNPNNSIHDCRKHLSEQRLFRDCLLARCMEIYRDQGDAMYNAILKAMNKRNAVLGNDDGPGDEVVLGFFSSFFKLSITVLYSDKEMTPLEFPNHGDDCIDIKFYYSLSNLKDRHGQIGHYELLVDEKSLTSKPNIRSQLEALGRNKQSSDINTTTRKRTSASADDQTRKRKSKAKA